MIHQIIRAFNSIPTFWLIYFLLCFNHILPVTTQNEDMYFGLALQYMDPSWIPNSFTFTESPGTRLLFQWLIGPLLMHISAEVVSVLGQLIFYAIYSALLNRIFKYFALNNLFIFFLLQLIFINLQAFVGGEWIFRNFETKSFSYVFIFLSVINLIEFNWKRATLWVVPAFYFHVLVGGWFFLSLMLFFLLKKFSIQNLLYHGLLFTLLVSPFLIYLLSDVLIGQQKVIDGINLDWVYTYYRNPHHTVTFHMGWPWFQKHRLEGLLMLIFATTAGSFFFKRSSEKTIQTVWLFCFSTYIILFIAYGYSYFDITGKILKFYVFRIASISFLLTLILLGKELIDWLDRRPYGQFFYILMLMSSLIYLPQKGYSNWIKQREINNNEDYAEVITYLNEISQPGEVITGLYGTLQTYIPRKTRLEPVVSSKFVPSGTEKLYEWYKRTLDKKTVENDLKKLDDYIKKYGVKYILTNKSIEKRQLTFKSGDLILYKVNDD